MDSKAPLSASRRAILGAGATLLAAAPAAAASTKAAEAGAMSVLERYAGFGDKASGGPGDTASGAWLESELKALGYAVAASPSTSRPTRARRRPSRSRAPRRP